MAKPQQFTKWVKGLEDVVETVACKGTAIEQASFKVRGKSFLFVQGKDGGVIVRLKLGPSAAAAAKIEGVEIGIGGWTTIRLDAKSPAPKQARAWIAESYALSTQKKTAKKTTAKKKTAKKKTAKKKTAKKKTAKKKTAKKKTAKKKTAKKKTAKKKTAKKKTAKKKR